MGKLTDKQIRAATGVPGKTIKISDGDGLYLIIGANGTKWWRFDYRFEGRQLTLSFGIYGSDPSKVGLAAARDQAIDARRKVKAGINPSAERKAAKQPESVPDAAPEVAAVPTFRTVSTDWLDMMGKANRAGKTSDRDNRMVRYLNGAFGDKAIDAVDLPSLATLLTKFEKAGTYDTRSRLQGVALRVMGFAHGRGFIDRNPFVGVQFAHAFTGAEATKKKRPAVTDAKAFGTLLRKIDFYEGRGSLTQIGLKLLALTFVRPGDVSKGEWSQIDWKNRIWSIPPDALKMRTFREKHGIELRPHRVYLANQTVTLLRELQETLRDMGFGSSRFMLPGRAKARTMSENTLNCALKALGYDKIHCAHGFRSSASTLLNRERIGTGINKRRRFERNAVELQLDHVDESTRADYDRDELWEERIIMMQYWADYIDRLRTSTNTQMNAA